MEIPIGKGEGKGFHRYSEVHSFNAKLPKGSKGISPSKKIIVDVGSGNKPYKQATHVIDPNISSKGVSEENPKLVPYLKKMKIFNTIGQDFVEYNPSKKPIVTGADEIRATYALSHSGISKALPEMKRMLKPGGRIFLEDYMHKEEFLHPFSKRLIFNQAKRNRLDVVSIKKIQKPAVRGGTYTVLRATLRKPTK